MRSALGLWRLLRVLLHIASALYILQYRFPKLDAGARNDVARTWTQQTLRLMGVHLQVLGQPPAPGPLLVLANHISWLDILVINASQPCRFISKAEVRAWPVLGQLVERAGTLFIERQKRNDAVRVAQQAAEALRAGDRVAFFPEGTTGDGQGIMPFHAALLQAAIDTESPVLPLAVVYVQGRGQALLGEAARHDAPVYVSGVNLLQSMWRIVTARELQAVLHWGEPDTALGRDRRAWAESLRAEVARLAKQPLLPRTGEPPRWQQKTRPTQAG